MHGRLVLILQLTGFKVSLFFCVVVVVVVLGDVAKQKVTPVTPDVI